MFFKVAYLLMKLSFSGNICFKNINSSSTKTLLFKQKHGTHFLFLIAFVKERFHNAVEIDILGIFEEYSSLQIWPPQKFFRGEIIQGK